LAKALAILGYVDEATTCAAESVRRVDPSLHSTFATVVATSCRVAYWLDDEESIAERAGTVAALSEQKGFPYWEVSARIYTAWLAARRGDAAGGIAQIDSAIADLDRIGVILNRPFFLTVRADILVLAHRTDEAIATLDNALEISARTGDAYMLADLHRMKGELLLPTETAAGEHELRTALAIARRQEARLWELRAALGLARHLSATGRNPEAHAILAPVCNWFAPTVALEALSEARRWLAQADV